MNYYWVSPSSGVWSSSSNWSTSPGGAGGAGVPSTGDTAIFTPDSNTDCRFDLSLTGAGIVFQSGYTATSDFASDNLDHSLSSIDSTNQSTNTIALGTQTITLTGTVYLSNINWTGGVANFVLDGNFEFNGTANANMTTYANLTIAAGASITSSSGNLGISARDILVYGSYTIAGSSGDVKPYNSLQVLGAGQLNDCRITPDINYAVTINIENDCSSCSIKMSPKGAAGQCHISLNNTSIASVDCTPGGGPGNSTIRFYDDLNVIGSCHFQGGSNPANTVQYIFDADILVGGDFSLASASGGYTWSSTGVLVLNGSGGQLLDLNNDDVGGLEINKPSGLVSLVNDFIADGVTVTSGSLDFQGYGVTTGDFSAEANTSFVSTVSTGTLTCDNFALNGLSGLEISWSNIDISASTTAISDYASATNSDASGGVNVSAYHFTDNGGNTGWVLTSFNVYWVSGSSANWNSSTNWSTTSGGVGGWGVPGEQDQVNFNGSGLGNCRLNTSIAAYGIKVASGFTGSIDGASDNLDHIIGEGGFEMDGGSVSFGDGTWDIYGDHLLAGAASADWNSSLVRMFGVGAVIEGKSVFYDLEIHESMSTFGTGGLQTVAATNSLTIKAGKTLTLAHTLDMSSASVGLKIESGAVLTGGIRGFTGAKIPQMDGTFSPVEWRLNLTNVSSTTGEWTPGTYDAGHIYLDESGPGVDTVIHPAGSFVYTGTMEVLSEGVFDLATNSPNITFQGNVLLASASQWTKGTGTLTFSGSANQSVDFAGESTEAIVVNKPSGTLTLAGNVSPNSLTLTSGVLDFGGSLITTSTFVAQAGTSVSDTVGGGAVSCVDFELSGSMGSVVTWSTVAVAASGTAVATYATVSDSDASGGVTVTTTDSTDGGGNTNWNFGSLLVLPVFVYHYMQMIGLR